MRGLAHVSHRVTARGKVDDNDVPRFRSEFVDGSGAQIESEDQLVLLADFPTVECDIKREVELVVHLFAPLLAKRSGTQDEDPLRQSPEGQFFDGQAGLDCLTEADLVGEHGASAKTRQRVARDGFLVWHPIDIGHIDSEQLVEIIQCGELFALKAKLDDLEWVKTGCLELVT
ncbi:hypothetical protein BTO20_06710 [Mycobacterium dioxanotrophicus]|uniref:Uncharacterized protein n=1 Tax=Mycobacterium dioxanotrophicus TaxID=482462 RepID=A0A1Y0BZL1_9MYCO|nr:hypothetical protein BTO20_06710 [Mycobacterium dioxanotrophicus]